MQQLYFATGNPHKIREAQAIMPIQLEQLAIDLPEIQSLDVQEIIAAKLTAAYENCKAPVIVEDVSAELEALGGLPGPFIKFFEQRLGKGALHTLLAGHDNKRVRISATIGLHDGRDMHFFVGEYWGTVVAPRGENGFGFDFVIVPDGYDITMAEMPPEQKNTISHRYLALAKLSAYLRQSSHHKE